MTPEEAAQVRAEYRQEIIAALTRVQVGGTYRRRSGGRPVTVTHIDHETGYVHYRNASGPAPSDPHRQFYIFEFLELVDA